MVLGSVTVAVLPSAPVVPGGTIPVTAKVTVPLTGRSTSASMSPVPAVSRHVPGAPLVQVQVNARSGGGSASCTRAATTSLGPALSTTTV